MKINWIRDRYKVIHEIPGGNMAKVFLCIDYHTDGNPEVIIKLFNKQSVDDELQNKSFFREVENLEFLKHKNIVKLLDKNKDNKLNAFYIALEFVHGKQLDKIIFSEELSYGNKHKIINQIFSAIAYSHSKNIIHRDIKPSNIIVDNEFNVKVIDFGISKVVDGIYDELTLCGFRSPKYASWEQQKGLDISFQSDIYSLGIVIYEILTGDRLQNGHDIQTIINNSEKFSYAQKSVNLKMVEKDLDKRYLTISEMKTEFNKNWVINEELNMYYIKITNSVINRLCEFNFIDSADKNSAINIITRDLEGESYLEEFKNKNKNNSNSNSYRILGKQFEMICVIDSDDGLSFIMTNIRFPRIDILEKNKQFALKLNIEWGIVIPSFFVSEDNDIKELITLYYEFKRLNSIKRNNEIGQKSIIDLWDKVLRLQRRSINEEKNAIQYKSFEVENGGERVHLHLKNELNEIPFDENLLLNMTSKYNITKMNTAGYLVDLKENKLILELSKDANVNDFAESGEISIDKRLEEVALKRQERSIKMIQYDEGVNKNFGDILISPSKARSTRLSYDLEFVSKNLDDSKKDAIENALSANDLFLLQGPPGTGKTTFISELVAQIIRNDPTSRILISSQSNVAVNHSMTKIEELIPAISMIRIGRREKLSLGVEKFLIEEQISNWTENVKKRCVNYLEEFRIVINVNSDIINKYKLIQEINALEDRLDEIEKNAIKCEIEKDIVKSKYNSLNKVLADIKKFSDTALSNSKIKYDTSIESIVEEFKNDYISLGMKFLQQLDEVNEISDKKQQLDLQTVELKEEKNKVINGIEVNKETLEVTNNEEFYEVKDYLEKQIEDNKKTYDKLAKIESITQEWFNRLGKDDEFAKAFLSQVSIIGATCLGIASVSYVNNLKFDWVIIDEAGRATPPELLVPTLLGKKVILVGDHKQLPPIINKTLDNENFKEEGITKGELEVSLFEYLEKNINDECKGILAEQYRMHPGIGNMISKVFYKNKLVSKTDVITKSHALTRWHNKGVVWVTTYNKQNKTEQPINSSSNYKTYRNPCEVDIIFKLLREIDNEYFALNLKKEVGVIAGYKAQKQLLKKIYESNFKNSFNNISLEIDTVDAFQGRETDIILYSIVRSNKEGKIGFLSDVRRLNVALSRARELLVLVGDHKSVTKNNYVNQENPFIEVLNYIKDNQDLCTLEEA